MRGSRLLLWVAAVLAGTAALLAVFGVAYNPILLAAAAPFGVAAYFLWSHATGRLEARMRARTRVRTDGPEPHDRDGGRGPRERADVRDRRRRAGRAADAPEASRDPGLSRAAAARVLGVEPDAEAAAIRRAFRERARRLHPDAPEGDEADFKRVRAAYETLRNDR